VGRDDELNTCLRSGQMRGKRRGPLPVLDDTKRDRKTGGSTPIKGGREKGGGKGQRTKPRAMMTAKMGRKETGKKEVRPELPRP